MVVTFYRTIENYHSQEADVSTIQLTRLQTLFRFHQGFHALACFTEQKWAIVWKMGWRGKDLEELQEILGEERTGGTISGEKKSFDRQFGISTLN